MVASAPLQLATMMTLPLNELLPLLLLGACTGFLAGLLGVGGGMIMVPFVTILLEQHAFPAGQIIKVAIATSLTTIVFTAISSVRAHHRRGGVRWEIAAVLAPGILVGSFAGAQFVGALPAALIATIFGTFLVWAATRMLRHRAPESPELARSLPGKSGMFGAGSLIGAISAVLGAGGAFLMVPFLTNRGLRPQQAVGTSAACGFPIALAGTIGYMVAGRGIELPAGTIGFVYLPALFAIAATSVLTAPLGARLAHALPTDKLKKVFACSLYLMSAYMLWKAWSLSTIAH